MQMEHCLRGRLSVRLDYVEAIGAERSPHCAGQTHAHPCEVGQSLLVGTPDVRNMVAWNKERVAQRGWLEREECDDGAIAIDLTSVW